MGVEQAVVSMFNTKENKAMKVMKFKWEINQMSICALLDSGSIHSFVNHTVLKEPELKVVQIAPMIVTVANVANEAKMVTDLQCSELKFVIQGNSFEKDMRVLDVQVYDMILELDWLTSLGPMKIDWGKGCIEFKHNDKEIKLRV
jgi:Retroviral aspartyl protease